MLWTFYIFEVDADCILACTLALTRLFHFAICMKQLGMCSTVIVFPGWTRCIGGFRITWLAHVIFLSPRNQESENGSFHRTFDRPCYEASTPMPFTNVQIFYVWRQFPGSFGLGLFFRGLAEDLEKLPGDMIQRIDATISPIFHFQHGARGSCLFCVNSHELKTTD